MKRFGLVALAGLIACSSGPPSPALDVCRGGPCDESTAFLCAAVRGNGERILAHFGALARITETKQPIFGISGGSSASITSFLVESIYLNEAIYDCGANPCSFDAWTARIALLLKSVQRYAETLVAELDPNAAIAPVVAAVTAELANPESPMAALLDDGASAEQQAAALEALTSMVGGLASESPQLSLLNEEVLRYLEDGPAVADLDEEARVAARLTIAKDIAYGVQNLGSFATDPGMFLRPSVLDWDAFAQLIGRGGDFYAGYGEANFESFLASCASSTVGKTWAEVSATVVEVDAGETTCGQLFDGLLAAHRAGERSTCDLSSLGCLARSEARCSRIDECVGEFLPSLISTSIIGRDAYLDAKNRYERGGSGAIESSFDDVRFGYFGYPDDLSEVAAAISSYDDAKSAKFLSLGQVPWSDALSLSPAEPGLSPARPFVDGNGIERVSAGGWSDLHPTRALRAMGCEEIVYITREGERESGFALEVAALLGMDARGSEADDAATAATYSELYDLDNPQSAYQQSIDEADAVWCTSWDEVDARESTVLFDHAYSAPMEARSEFFAESAYERASADLGKRGCSSSSD